MCMCVCVFVLVFVFVYVVVRQIVVILTLAADFIYVAGVVVGIFISSLKRIGIAL